MKKQLIILVLVFPLFCAAQVGVNTQTPQRTLYVNGSLQVVNELNVGGNSSTGGSAGTAGQLLISNGPNLAPQWQSASATKGNIANTYYVQGTSAVNTNAGSTADVPGMTITLTVPVGSTQIFLFNIIGYASLTPTGNTRAQGAFALLKDGVKISSAYSSSSSATNLVNLPAPTTLLKTVTLSEGTYIFKVQYSS